MANAGVSKAKGGKKNRKLGRNVKACGAYKLEDRRRKNKIRKLERHIKKYPVDQQAKNRLHALHP